MAQTSPWASCWMDAMGTDSCEIAIMHDGRHASMFDCKPGGTEIVLKANGCATWPVLVPVGGLHVLHRRSRTARMWPMAAE